MHSETLAVHGDGAADLVGGPSLTEVTGLPPIAVPRSPVRDVIAVVDRAFARTIEAIAALLVIAETLILVAGIVSRYVMHNPLIWSDELAQMLFMWLAMLGGVIALRRGEHMRMTTFVKIAPPDVRATLEAVALGAAIAFLGLILAPAYDYAADERFMSMPGLDISNGWRAAALPVGMLLMLIAGALRLAVVARLGAVIVAIVLIGAIGGGLFALQPWLGGLGNLNLVIFFVGIIALCVFAGVPIAFAFGLATFGYLSLTTTTPMVVLVGRMGEGLSHLILLAVPMFIFLGLLLEVTGMARRLIQFLAALKISPGIRGSSPGWLMKNIGIEKYI